MPFRSALALFSMFLSSLSLAVHPSDSANWIPTSIAMHSLMDCNTTRMLCKIIVWIIKTFIIMWTNVVVCVRVIGGDGMYFRSSFSHISLSGVCCGLCLTAVARFSMLSCWSNNISSCHLFFPLFVASLCLQTNSLLVTEMLFIFSVLCRRFGGRFLINARGSKLLWLFSLTIVLT